MMVGEMVGGDDWGDRCWDGWWMGGKAPGRDKCTLFISINWSRQYRAERGLHHHLDFPGPTRDPPETPIIHHKLKSICFGVKDSEFEVKMGGLLSKIMILGHFGGHFLVIFQPNYIF